MTRDTSVSRLRTRWDPSSSRSSGEAIDGSSSAEEIKRIVEVAEVLEIDPHLARTALEGGNRDISTECGLSRSVAIVEKRLTQRD